jgi:nicotinate-nucleotide pyrophosphorylase (carboxylating)
MELDWREKAREDVLRALREDCGNLGFTRGDITSFALVDEDTQADAKILLKADTGVLAGIDMVEMVFHEVDSRVKIKRKAKDGDRIQKGQEVLNIQGSARAVLTAERTALNFLQHLSGIATETADYVQAVEGMNVQILDTRKTTPGLRLLEKYAVACGGGVNHRMGLHDAFLVKDNHLALMKNNGGLKEAVRRARHLQPQALLTIEAETLEQVTELVDLGVERILLDNMSNAQMAEAVRIVAGRCKVEASGGITLDRVRAVAATGVDFISIGALTHSVRALDFSLRFS